MLHVRDAALRFWTRLPHVHPLGPCVITEDLLLVWHAKLAAPLSARQYKIRTLKPPSLTGDLLAGPLPVTQYKVRTLKPPSLTDDLAAFPFPTTAERQLLGKPLIANVEFDVFCPSCNIVGKHFVRPVTAQSQFPIVRKAQRRQADSEASRPKTPVLNSDLLWDTILLVLEPPLDLNLPKIVDLPHDLYHFQRAGIKFLAETKPGALLGDDMGLGKTVQAIVALRLLFQAGQIKRALIVCPRSVLRQWEGHLKEWAPLLRVSTVDGDPYVRRGRWGWAGRTDAHVYLTTYGIMRQDIEVLRRRSQGAPEFRFDVVILDEITNIKNPTTKQSQAAKNLPKKFGWGLSGTPLENRPEDVVAEFAFLYPRLFAGQPILSPKDVRDKIKPYFLRRRKEEVLRDLPPKIQTEHWIKLTSKQQAAYERAYETGVVDLKEKGRQVTITHILALLQRLKQICNVDPRSRESAKIEWLVKNFDQMISNTDKVLIFSQWLESGVEEIYEQLPEEYKHKALKYTGQVTGSSRRQAIIDEFSGDPEKKILLLTYGTGQHGLNLQAANYVVLFDHWWNPATEQQAVDRTHRIGQSKGVFVYDLWVEDTIEERIYEILQHKRQLYGEVIDSLAVRGVDGTGLSEEELFGLFDLTPARSEREKKKPTVEHLLALSPDQFEELLAEIYRRKGYTARVTPNTRDEGIDVIAYKQDAPNWEYIAIQCKNHRAPVGVGDARNLLGAVTDPKYSQAILVATAGFTQDCEEFNKVASN